jgi:putative phosphoesterase
MRLAALYDVHGNLPALEAVLRDVRNAGVDLIVSGGDLVPGPMPREVVLSLRNLDIPVTFIRGNGDREVLALRGGEKGGRFPESMRAAMQWNASQLDDESAVIMARWPAMTSVHSDSLGEVVFCHATPRNDTEIFLRTTREEALVPVFESVRADVVVCGHTHMQFDRTVGATRVINAGSVGMSFEGPGAYWLLVDSRIELRRTEYDVERAAERVRATSYPQATEFAERSVLRPPSAAETIAAFTQYELREDR